MSNDPKKTQIDVNKLLGGSNRVNNTGNSILSKIQGVGPMSRASMLEHLVGNEFFTKETENKNEKDDGNL